MGFDASFFNNTKYENAKRGLSTKVLPLDSPRGCIWAIRYAYLHLLLSSRRWQRIRQMYNERVPNIAKKGEELISIVKENGWCNQDKALRCMIALRDSLGMPPGEVIIVDGRTGLKY